MNANHRGRSYLFRRRLGRSSYRSAMNEFGLGPWLAESPGSLLLGLFVLLVITRCPSCLTGTRVRRTNRKTGTRFTGCSRYPHCTWTK